MPDSPTQIPFLHDILVLFGTAMAVIVVSYRLRLPPVVGFLVTGMMVGPSGLGWIGNTAHIEAFAELGVVFLLFGIGLELSLDRLRKLGRLLAVGGGLQLTLTVAAVVAVGTALGQPLRLALYAGSVVALSSTAVVFKLYVERRELDAPHGRIATGILLFQDFLFVPLLLVVPFLAGSAELSGTVLVKRFGLGLLIIAAVFAAGRYLIHPFLRLLVRTRVRELFVMGALFGCLGGALVTESLGFSPVLGAFLAGILISESEYRHQVLAETGPFRDIFNSIFFISVGMLLELDFAVRYLPQVLGLGLGVVAIKAAVVAIAVTALGFPLRTRLLAALGLAQIGELSFVLVRSGRAHELLDPWQYQLAIATIVLTLLMTPLWIASAPRFVRWLQGWGRAPARPSPADDEVTAGAATVEPAVVIVGFGLNGRHLARVLRSARIPYVVVDLSDRKVQEAKEAGEPIVYGDATRPEIQRRCGVEQARVAIFAISDPFAVLEAVRVARQLHPGLFIVARGQRFDELAGLRAVGADVVVVEEFESSIEIVTTVLKRLHVPGNVIAAQSRLLRADGYQILRLPDKTGLSEQLVQALAAGATDTFLLASDHAAVGRSLARIDVRKRTGATVLAVVRGDRPIRNPAPDLELAAGDLLVLVGGHAEVEGAFRLLDERSPAAGNRGTADA